MFRKIVVKGTGEIRFTKIIQGGPKK